MAGTRGLTAAHVREGVTRLLPPSFFFVMIILFPWRGGGGCVISSRRFFQIFVAFLVGKERTNLFAGFFFFKEKILVTCVLCNARGSESINNYE